MSRNHVRFVLLGLYLLALVEQHLLARHEEPVGGQQLGDGHAALELLGDDNR